VIALDANVLLRILLNDDPKQSRQAQAIVAGARNSMATKPLRLNH